MQKPVSKQTHIVNDKHTQVKTSIFDINEAISFLSLDKNKAKYEDYVVYEADDKSVLSKTSLINYNAKQTPVKNDFAGNFFPNMNNQSFKKNKNYRVKPINIIKNDLSASSNISTPSSKCAWSSNLDDSEDNSERPKSSSSSFLYSPDIVSDSEDVTTRIEMESPESDFLITNDEIEFLVSKDIELVSSDLHPDSELSDKNSEKSDDCPKCLASSFTYTHYYAQGSKYLKIEVVEPPNPKLRTKQSRQFSRASTVKLKCAETVTCIDSNFKNTKDKNHKNANKSQSPTHRHFETVSIDLTGSNVTYTVEQHANFNNYGRQSANIHTLGYNPYNVSSNCYNHYAKNQTIMLFYLARPRYCLVPMYYLTYPNLNSNRNNLYYINKNPNKYKTASVGNKNLKSDNYQPVECTVPLRPWNTLNKLETGKPVAIFSVMCYNVLCENYATRNLYSYCPSWALSWDHRKKRILQEILLYAADIVNLQEVETEQFFSFFEPEMKSNGYESIFCPKSRARTMSDAEKRHVDGCAIFFKSSKYRLVKEHMVEFNKMAIETAEGSHEMINRVMTKDNIGLAALLETKDKLWENGQPASGEKLILVATCHIHWDPEFSDVKLIQTMMLMNRLKEIAEENQNLSLPLILCGDLNSLPDSGVVEYLSKGSLDSSHKDFKDFGYTSSLSRLSVSSRKDAYFHAFNLASAYSPQFMPYSSYTPEFQGMIDYVFYSSNWMNPLGVLGAFDPQWFSKNNIQGCPNPQIPSDHLPLLVEFQFFPDGI